MRPVRPDNRRVALQWAACGASVTGQEHERRGLGCDDAYSCGIVGDFVVASVADGAGSVSGTSAWGAWAACQSVMHDALQPTFIDRFHGCEPAYAERMIRWLFDNALKRVTDQATALGVHPTMLSTTLCVGLADCAQAVFGQIGDGVIVAEHAGQVESLLIERKHDYANITSFLQSENAFDESFRIAVRPEVTAFALSTDGMSYKITDMATGQAFEPFFRDSWRHVRSGARADQFAALLRGIEDDQTGDDKTMVLAAALPEPGRSASSSGGFFKDHSPAPGTAEIEARTPVDIPGDQPRCAMPLHRQSHRRLRLWGRRRP